MKILLFPVPTSDFLPMPMRVGFYFPNTGILTIAAYLEQHNYKVKIIDMIALNLTWKDIPALIKAESPDFVGISGLTRNAYMCMGLAKIIKQVNPRIVTVLGGAHFSLVPEESLRICKEIDYVIRGEGEVTFLELIKKVEEGAKKEAISKVEGLAYLSGEDYIKTPLRPLIKDLDTLPLPAYHLLPMSRYKVSLLGKNGMGCNFSRGCLYNCKFCSEMIIWNHTRRGRSAGKIIEELELLVNNYGKKTFWFSDSDFLQDEQRNIKFLEEMEARDLDIKFLIYSRADVLIKNKSLLKRLKKIGLTAVIVGGESFSQKMLDEWNKKITVTDIESVSGCIQDAKIPIFECDLLCGSSDDDKNALVRSLRISHRLEVDFFKLSILTPWPGTELFNEMKQKGLIKVWDYRRYDIDHGIMGTKHLSIKRLEKLHAWIVAMWWLDPRRIVKNFKNKQRRLLHVFQLKCICLSILNFLFAKLTSRRKNKVAKDDSIIEEFYLRHLDYIGIKREDDCKTFKIWSCNK